ncbi:hypothetical protein N7457_000447 [Penicillium paradoxum]|uniref:uncharacterized protein n=1 Tax=Penicillium paradoxum TaxID=176176 RepID=UPI002548911E|nr:uncharacterized protein N7457_000447 [Penicillium paradoxum]KAJ5793848.1 hypothetical protein N7457_000447 [Penicillium paradoxum]
MSYGSPGREVPMSQNEQSHYVRTQDYVRTPKFSRPPLGSGKTAAYGIGAYDDTVIVDTKIFSRDSHDFAEDDFICPGFFNHVDLGGFTRRFTPPQWTYEMRHQAQSILPFLSLGPSVCLRDADYIRKQGFTLLLAIRSRHSALARLISGDKAANEVGIMADTIDVLDTQELISAFPRAIRRINDHLAGMDLGPNGPVVNGSQQKRKVLVFCESGNERSASVVIAYLMVMLNIGSHEATHMIQQRRFCASIEDAMRFVLTAFESILSAKRDVERAKRKSVPHAAATLAPPSLSPILAKKRSFQDHRDDDVAMEDDMDMDGDVDPFDERKPSAPFQDRVI